MATERRQSNGRRLSGWRPEDVENLLDANDDEEERREAAELKREMAERKAQQARSPYRETPRHQARTAILTDMYSESIKLCAENKVNEKNSWSLDLIDHMTRMIENPSADGPDQMTNFQFASSTLDAGVKIYSYRVDSVYSDTFRLMGGLHRTTKRGDAAEVEDGEALEEGGSESATAGGAQKKEKRRPVSSGSNLETNTEKLNMQQFERAFAVDPLFHRTSAKFDEGGAKGLLLHNLPVRNGCQLVFDSNDAACAERPTPSIAQLRLGALRRLIPDRAEERRVCTGLAPFTRAAFGLGAGDGADEEYCGDSDDCAAVDEGDYGAMPSPPADPEPLSWADDSGVDSGAPLGADMFGQADLDPEGAARELALQQQTRALEEQDGAAAFMSVDELLQAGKSAPGADVHSELSESGGAQALHEQAQRLLQIGHRWAGPSHWKFRAAAQPAAAESTKRTGSKRTKEPFVVDFSRSTEAAAAVLASKMDPKGAVLSDATLAKASASDITLPKDCGCSIEVLSKLFHKPSARVRCVRRRRVLRTAGEPNETLAPATFVGDADEAEGGAFDDEQSDSGGGAFEDDGDSWGGTMDGSEGFASPTADGVATTAAAAPLELVKAPTRVQKIEIGYAKVAKQVDIKGLKTTLWAVLQDQFAASADVEQVSVAAVLELLPSKLPTHIRLADVSFAYVFICLLHLANEKGLEICGDDDLADMRITPPAAK
eukprot:CAMPEP_0183335996 /NCGR_PEP_ID=MMETSP0164_2-20130417/4114_1 /TAXON_ID=221442 /ORGANISM="Coccolithus pelagicus ssp braarudi, Strain PLY182g" /LENGTH=716 /DNA_ID=CAMNT_0025505445 /DNA_START=42 /DNA_END=2192 /DNA_ORIENTATION=-